LCIPPVTAACFGRRLRPASATFIVTDWQNFICTDRRVFRGSETEHYEKWFEFIIIITKAIEWGVLSLFRLYVARRATMYIYIYDNGERKNSQKATKGKMLLSIVTETALANQYSILEEIKSRVKTGTACYHTVQNLLSSSLLFKNIKIRYI
jgi:hypothetical protein